jgi:hypothetical protein
MSRWARGVVVILWALSLVGVAAWGARAQEKLPPDVVVVRESGHVLSGPDIGFRVQRMERGRALGMLVVKMGDEWVEVGAMPRAVPLR